MEDIVIPDISGGEAVTPSSGQTPSASPLPHISDTVSYQLSEISNDLVLDDGTVNSGITLAEQEPVYRKRLVKIVNGKIADERIVYMTRIAISAAGGYGDSYAFVKPTVSGGAITGFTAYELDLPSSS